MFHSFCGCFLLVQAALAGGYAPPPAVQPSPLVYGSQLPVGSYNSPYAAPNLGGGGLVLPQPPQPLPPLPPPPPAPVFPLPPSPSAPLPSVSPPQTYNYPIQGGQTVYEPAPVYSDQYETTTLPPPPPPPPTTPYIPPVVEQVDESEQYGVPEIPSSFNANPRLPSVQPVPTVIVTPSVSSASGGYAPSPVVQPAPDAYGAAPVASSSYGGNPTYNELEYTAGEVPVAVVQPGNQSPPPFAPGPADTALNNFYPPRAIRPQKKTALKAKAKKV